MKRPWQVWFAFALCSLLVAAAMGGLTRHALRVDRERSAARVEAELEQRVSLALWRMDTKLAPLIAEEATRPHELYESFITVAAPAGKGDATRELIPSPLLATKPENVLLNFSCPTFGEWSSPQAPPVEQSELAADNGLSRPELEANRQKLNLLAAAVDVPKLISLLPRQPLPSQSTVVADAAANRAVNQRRRNESPAFYGNYAQINSPAAAANAPNAPPGEQVGAQTYQVEDDPFGPAPNGPAQQQAVPSQQIANADLSERNSRFQQAAEQEFTKQRGVANSYLWQKLDVDAPPVVENVSRPVWIGDQLLLARRVDRGDQTSVQGSWLDWPRLKAELLAETADLLPQADLRPIRAEGEGDPTRMLAGLPVELVVADSAAAIAREAAVDGPLQWALGFGWIALTLALAAVALLLWGVLALSERRAAFVSSVTHELRTPLTTFRMYAEMLARDMVPTPERRREYLETLKTESERLTHLVENVLSYARLERGRRPQRSERTTPAALVERFEPRLAERAAQAGMELECKVDAAAAEAPLLTDIGVVEQILFNLVDNAAKYAGRADDRRICLQAGRQGNLVLLTVSDFGPGFASPRQATRLAPFSKSAQEAAESAPGVGLGLALCRRLARELGGQLEIAGKNGPCHGAAVTLRLPIGG